MMFTKTVDEVKHAEGLISYFPDFDDAGFVHYVRRSEKETPGLVSLRIWWDSVNREIALRNLLRRA